MKKVSKKEVVINLSKTTDRSNKMRTLHLAMIGTHKVTLKTAISVESSRRGRF